MTDSDDAMRGRAAEMEPAHTALHDLLADYATAATLGADPDSAYPDVAAHLKGCVDCRTALQGLLELTVDAYEGRVAPATSYPSPDLTFLRRETDAAETRDQSGRAAFNAGSGQALP